MIWYVALIAIVNLGLGYVLAVFLSRNGAQLVPAAAGPAYSDSLYDDDADSYDESEEWES